ncbi:4-hydroxybenzoate octaprenyltransferase [Candidatus Liberibacter solanacearum]
MQILRDFIMPGLFLHYWRNFIMNSVFSPYAHLARLHMLTGWHLVLLPSLWSTIFAAYPLRRAGLLSWSTIFWYLCFYLIGSIIVRSAGCTWNDLVDHNIDSQVSRTRSRPLPAGQCSRSRAYIFAIFQFAISFILLLQLNYFVICIGFAVFVVLLIYPFSKRFIPCPQVVLGICFGGGVFIGWGSLHESFSWTAFWLFMGTIFWVIHFDTVYAHQDKKDDERIGINSTARLFADHTKIWISILYSLFTLCFMIALYLVQANFFAWIGLLIALFFTIKRIISLEISSSDQCFLFFKTADMTGMFIFASLIFSLFLDQF